MRSAVLLLALLLQVLTPTGVQVLFGDAPPPQDASRCDWLAREVPIDRGSDDADERALAEQEDAADEDEERDGDAGDDGSAGKVWLARTVADTLGPGWRAWRWSALCGQHLARDVYLHCVQARGPPLS